METFLFFFSSREFLFCSLKKFPQGKIPSRKNSLKEKREGKKKKMSSFHLWDNPSFSDLTIRFADGDVPGHKVVFAQKSDVLQAFFEDTDSTEPSVLDMTEYSRFFCQVIVYECIYDYEGKKAPFDNITLQTAINGEGEKVVIDKKYLHPSVDELMEAVLLVDKFNMKGSIKMIETFLDNISDEDESSIILKWPLWTPNIQEEYRDFLDWFLVSFLGEPKRGKYTDEIIKKLRTLPIGALCFWASKADYRDVLLCAKKMEDNEDRDSALAIVRMMNFTSEEMEKVWKSMDCRIEDKNIREEIKTKAISLLERTMLFESNQYKQWQRHTILDLCKEHKKRKRDED
jgi:hypothetical protein